MKKALSRLLPRLALSTLALSTLAFSAALAGCTTEAARPARGSGDITIGASQPPPKQLVCAPGSFSGGNECIPVKPAECAPGTHAEQGECVPDPRTVEAPPVETPPKIATDDALPLSFVDRDFGMAVDPRPNWQSPRTRQLLITELQGLEALFQSVPKDSPDRPKLIYRLATGYVELEAAVTRNGGTATGRAAEEELAKRRKIAQAARTVAIKYYRMLNDQYPKFCVVAPPSKTSGCIDEVLYHMALEYIRGGDLVSARSTLLVLIKDWPKTDKLGHAYFLFGELFRNETANDPTKLPLAEQSYAKAAEMKGPMRVPSLTRLAEVQDAQGNTKAAAATRAKIGANVASP